MWTWKCSPLALLGIAFACSAAAGEPQALPTMRVVLPHSTISYTLVKIPAGTIELPPAGAGEAPRVVKIQSIWVGTTEVTWDSYHWWAMADDMDKLQRQAAIDAKARPSQVYHDTTDGWGAGDQPAIHMSYHAAELYCQWLSKQTGHKLRLPTEAEFEYFCRAGGPPLDNLTEKQLDAIAWFDANSQEMAHGVARKKPNAWGLYDTLGNLAEWVQQGDGKKPFAMGGAWNRPASQIRPSFKLRYNRAWQSRDCQDPQSIWWYSDCNYVGIRMVADE